MFILVSGFNRFGDISSYWRLQNYSAQRLLHKFLFFFRTKSNLGSNKTPAIDTKPLSCRSWGQKALFYLKNEILEGKVFSLCHCTIKFPGTFGQIDLGKVQSVRNKIPEMNINSSNEH